ncbi:DUF6929 family protein [Salisaeta longa]|uniref:DUF6929 family protein n=1 Tax=Salisaeta longa TaxID=503170 RepID=UPI00040F9BB8|nr:hypothetical protein [Salisaeta longa]
MSQSIARRSMTHDPALACHIVRSTPLVYADDPDDTVDDRPAHVRAASGLVYLIDRMALVQDDANFLGLVDPSSHAVTSVPLPPAPDGRRAHDYDKGTGHNKLDLEACVAVPGTDNRLLIAFGSGSNEKREWVVLVDWRTDGDRPQTYLHHAPAFYATLREAEHFAGAGLNIEGAVFVDDDTLRLYQRGNADPTDEFPAIDATADVSWKALRAHIQDPEDAAPPTPSRVIHYDIGELHGVRLTFSDAEWLGDGRALFSASAERGTTGEVTGSVLGIIDGSDDEQARWAELIDEDGTAFEGKIEGITVLPDQPHRIAFVIDADDATEPSRIYEAELSGDWFPAG